MSGCGWMRLTACAKWILTIVVTSFNVRWTRFAPIRWSLAKWFFKAICQYMAKWGKVAWWYYECIFILLLIYFLERFSKLSRSSIIDESLIFFPSTSFSMFLFMLSPCFLYCICCLFHFFLFSHFSFCSSHSFPFFLLIFFFPFYVCGLIYEKNTSFPSFLTMNSDFVGNKITESEMQLLCKFSKLTLFSLRQWRTWLNSRFLTFFDTL